MSFFRAAFRIYSKQLHTNPYRTNCISGGVLGFVGDLICQKGVEKVDTVDWTRSQAFTGFCVYYQGGFDTWLYGLYGKYLTAKRFGGSVFKAGMAASLLDNLVHVPLLYMPAYFATMGAWQGDSLEKLKSDTQAAYKNTVAACCALWIPLQLLNFTVVPLHLRVLFVNFGCLAWNVILDYLSCVPQTNAQSESPVGHASVQRLLENSKAGVKDAVQAPGANLDWSSLLMFAAANRIE